MNSWPEVVQPKLSNRFKLPELQIFDSASQKLKQFRANKNRQIYVCGITPYDATHLGHAATYLTFDLINRYWRAQGSEVNYIQNITDIDDPLLERAARDNVDWQVLAKSQIDLFRGDMVDLHIHPPKIYAGAIEEIPEVVRAIENLERKNSVYPVESDLYFNIKMDSTFGNRSHLDQAEALKIFAECGGDPNRLGKQNRLDPLLWLANRPNEPEWPAPFGNGRPGWHIECAAIALKYSKPEGAEILDIQGGGRDLIFPHHEMSAAQVSVLTGKELAFAYVHTGLIGLEGEKMSKSKGNLLFVSKLIIDGVDPMAIRLSLLNRKFYDDTMWSYDRFEEATKKLELWRLGLSRTETPDTDLVIEAIIISLSENLDSVSAIKAIDNWCSAEGTGGNPGELSRAIDALLGIAL